MTTTFSEAMERFFEELAKTPRTWVVLPYGAIKSGGDCPSIVMFQFTRNLTGHERLELYRAEDLWRSHNNHALRARLLECCGLSEVGK